MWMMYFKLHKHYFSPPTIMHTRSSDENSVCLSNACIVTRRRKDLSRFLCHTKDHLA